MQYDPQEFEKQQKALLTRTKISLYGACGWGLVAAFLMVGLFTKNKDFAVIGIALMSVVWVQSEIITRAIASFAVLRHWKEMMSQVDAEVKKEETPKDGDGQ